MLRAPNRYSILFGFWKLFIALSFLVRTILLIMSWKNAAISIGSLFSIYFKGFVFDLGVASFFTILYAIYLLLIPQKWNQSRLNKTVTYVGFFLTVLIVMFSFFAEFTFWGEFESRFNFIAVDYLVYTFEVVNNINQSYPLPYLIGGMLLVTSLITWWFYKKGIFAASFSSDMPFRRRSMTTVILLLVPLFYIFQIKNNWAERTDNRYRSELSKAGIYSFFSAFKNNELSYSEFYKMDPDADVFARMRNLLAYPDTKFTGSGDEILRQITATDTMVSRPNVIMITIESFSADFMKRFGNTQGITPVLDSLAKQSVLFTNMYATGTRTVRGMEALTLAVPPTPGSSIVRRNDNEGLFTVGSIFKDAGYKRTFFYGGDGYFDNMNQFFSGNGFDIVDRGRKIMMKDKLATARTFIADKDVQFENAWGICDEDIYKAVIRDADEDYKQGKKFFNFVMTTSNHRPFTYPANKIDIPQGSREGAVRYTDYAIGKLVEEAKTKPWFANTVFIFVADHCASSAGKNEINVSKYHIPCLVYNLPNTKPVELSPVCSQIDLYPTVFNYLNWSYKSNLFGENVNAAQYQPRALVGTYQKLGYLKNDTLIVLGPQQKADCYAYKQQTDEQKQAPMNDHLLHEAIANYQSAYQLYKNGGMREK